ncbi:hypothetical protein [Comamonas thiooxydans]|uniref:hypothetical protein n=1 Tax=Comamonas thiooxydans TaxID=363952 RepID=UPI00050FF509|nr:hypothetical protein [Comamonas thiooxydans]KGH23591.1 hypothetical protein P606_11790 [Comamonas thiooxydans]
MHPFLTFLKQTLWRVTKFVLWTVGIMAALSFGLTYLLLQPGNLEKYNSFVQSLAESRAEMPAQNIDGAVKAGSME